MLDLSLRNRCGHDVLFYLIQHNDLTNFRQLLDRLVVVIGEHGCDFILYSVRGGHLADLPLFDVFLRHWHTSYPYPVAPGMAYFATSVIPASLGD